MWPNPQFSADMVTFTEKTLNGKLHFLCSLYLDSDSRESQSVWEDLTWKLHICLAKNYVCNMAGNLLNSLI